MELKETTSFSDVSASSKASGYIQSAVKKGIISGYEDGTFKPADTISRVEMAYLLIRAFDLKETSNISFSDIPATGNQYEAINKIVTAGITEGYPDGKFRPTEDVNRQRFCLYL